MPAIRSQDREWWLVALAALFLLVLAGAVIAPGGCNGPCWPCERMVRVEFGRLDVAAGELVVVRACVDGDCGQSRQQASFIPGEPDTAAIGAVDLPKRDEPAQVTVTIRGRDGRLLARGDGVMRRTEFPRRHEDGSSCGGCPTINVRVDANSRRLRPGAGSS